MLAESYSLVTWRFNERGGSLARSSRAAGANSRTKPIGGSAGDVQDRIGLLGFMLQLLNRFGCRQDYQLDFSAFCFALHLVHDRQGSGPGADHEPLALPGDLLLQ